MSHHRRRRRAAVQTLLAASLATLVVTLLPTASPVRAADDFLRLSADATYRVVPSQREVRVRIDWDATNLQPNSVRRTSTGTITTRYYFNQIFFAVPPEARSITATSSGGRLSTSIRDKKGYREVRVRMPNLFYRQSRGIRVDFTLPGAKPRSSGDVRVGRAFTTFTAWAWGDPGRSSVRIILPSGFDAEGYGNDVTQRTYKDRVELTSGRVGDSTEWYRVVLADRPTGLTHATVAPGGHKVVVQAWPEDVAWRQRVAGTLEDGLPALETLIGLPWPIDDEMVVKEVHTPLLEGYAGFFDPSTEAITMSEELDDQTILHEASHAWFNQTLWADRWIDEGLAEHFADRVRETLGLASESDPTAIDRNAKGAFPLSTWPAPSRVDDEETAAREAFGYGAAYTVVRQIADAIGDDGMRAVLAAAEGDQSAYVGDGEPDTTGATMDWKRFLDLVEEVGGMEGADALFRQWVAADRDLSLLRERREARAAYDKVDAAGGEWAVPLGVRGLMALWRFDDARALMGKVTPVLDLRDDLDAASADLGLTSPTDLEATFEKAFKAEELAPVTKTLEARIAAAGEVAEGRTALAAERSPLVQLGLYGERPEAGYDAARSAFQAGDTAAVTAGVAATTAMLTGAESVGMTRALVIGGVALAVLLLLMLAIALVVRRRRRRLAVSTAPAGASTTLAASPEPEGARPEAPSTSD